MQALRVTGLPPYLEHYWAGSIGELKRAVKCVDFVALMTKWFDKQG